MKRHWMGGERRVAKKKKDTKCLIQKSIFEKYKEKETKEKYPQVVTQDVVSLLGINIGQIKKSFGNEEITVGESLQKEIETDAQNEELITENNGIETETQEESESASSRVQNEEKSRENSEGQIVLGADDFLL
ncbi:hypothetical protein EIN_525890 [Entamoeba invadens IP1]|uniref:Uncharacterized protein n=1 Tax=Entamoeba invadens IP1 TaxID=370355 RepID=A0A0A1UBI8_ENTIV|nr:hypothetical protein EIN_525890 [Entamoeba invadens IP1]ELP89594.1 hypothetical protein EIN_525890 [Entamoeba invadens IP1]|eukprot:XP_004256365.1 hypothetical protein EIN_525890 [Entamoeba invadens IP1]